jgi:hypothetical protein
MFTARVSAIALLAGIVISFAVAGSRLGVREDKFRKSVGEYLATIAEPGQTLFLEPAGRIPFYSGIETVYDEIGLTNPDILPYLKKDPLRAWIGFLKVNRADLLVQRDGILVNQTWQGYELTPDEARWFWGHYEVIKKFNYSDVGGEDWWSNFALLPGESDYVVLRKRTDSDSDLNSTVH